MKKALIIGFLFVLVFSLCPAALAQDGNNDIVYFNPDGGRYYHADRLCPAVSSYCWPMPSLPFEALSSISFRYLIPCPRCGAPERTPVFPMPTEEPLKSDEGESDLRTLEYHHEENGLTFLRITMLDGSGQVFTIDSFPPYCYLDTYDDDDGIMIHYFAEMAQRLEISDEFYGEDWFMSFYYDDDTWRLWYITNGRNDWVAEVRDGVYTFDDPFYNLDDPDQRWQWSAAFEDRLLEFDYSGIKHLIDQYNAAMPDRPSLQKEETESLREDVESQPWVTMENLREHADYVWNIVDETAAYTAQKDFFPIVLSPEEAYAALTRAYEEQGEAGTAAYLQAMGIGCAPNGRPVMHAMEADRPIQVVAFAGWGWGEEGSLLFMERTSVWYLVDFVDEACLDLQRCGSEGPYFLAFSSINHGTGCYAEYVDLYNLSAIKMEAGYTAYGYEVYDGCGISCYGAACWAEDGLHVFRKLCCLRYDETVGEYGDYVPDGFVLDVFDYALDENGSLTIVNGN